jgi:hypothetical protein
MLKFALEAAEATAPEIVETDLYSLSGKTIHPCDACYQCEKLGYCRKVDDDFTKLRDKLDRVGNSIEETFNGRALKVMGFLTAGSGFASGQESVLSQLNNHAVMEGCILVEGLRPVGYIGVGERVHYLHTMRDAYAEKDKDTHEAIDATEELGKQIVLKTMILKSGGKQNRELIKRTEGSNSFSNVWTAIRRNTCQKN